VPLRQRGYAGVWGCVRDLRYTCRIWPYAVSRGEKRASCFARLGFDRVLPSSPDAAWPRLAGRGEFSLPRAVPTGHTAGRTDGRETGVLLRASRARPCVTQLAGRGVAPGSPDAVSFHSHGPYRRAIPRAVPMGHTSWRARRLGGRGEVKHIRPRAYDDA
jgi:hypothetical protein